MSALIWIILFCLLNGLIAFIGIFSLLLTKKSLNKLVLYLVAFSAGALLSGAFFHLITESLESFNSIQVFSYTITGFIIFFIMEKFLHWHHCHKQKCKIHSFNYLILYGDGLHNFIDGLIIAASFIVSIPFGIITSILIISHEIPQELGDFGVLIYGGFSKLKALFYNFLSQLTCVIGGIIGFLFSGVQEFRIFLLPFAAGGFIYIAASDLIPEIRKEPSIIKSILYVLVFLIGIFILVLIKLLAAH
jgi:zinc and cadmium transporter